MSLGTDFGFGFGQSKGVLCVCTPSVSQSQLERLRVVAMACPVDHTKIPTDKGECPVESEGRMDMLNAMPADLRKQLPSPGQRRPLSTERMRSSIPKEKEGEAWECV